MNQTQTGLTEIPAEFIARIAEWFCADFDNPLVNPRMEKSKGLYRLAQSVTHGEIVELGTYQGNGAVALASGAQQKHFVYTIDDYDHHVDWMGNEPGAEDKALMLKRIKASGLPILWIDSTAQKAAAHWTLPVGLVFWDTGDETIMEDFKAWSPYLVSGGLFVMHDTDNRVFHSDEIEREARRAGWSSGPHYRTLYTVMKP